MASSVGALASSYSNRKISRYNFEPGFVFGAATSAYQIEGAYNADGKTLSMWDTYTINKLAHITDGSNGCVALDHYNKYKEDIDLMKKLGLDAYRFSIAWTRILPGGRLSGGVNRAGVKFYNDVIDYALSKGIQPYVTIFHWDIPTSLQEEYGGFASPKIVQDFAEYAEVCFFEFGDRVKHWITINESWTYTTNGYTNAIFPPNHGKLPTGPTETTTSGAPNHRSTHKSAHGVDQRVHSGSNLGTEPYLVAHHLILAHAVAVEIYRRDYKEAQKGIIGVTHVSHWFTPLEDTEEDKAAASRAVDFMWGWFMAPIVRGEYPPVMRERVGDRLPVFTPEQKKLITQSFDFIGLNYYTTNYVTYKPTLLGAPQTYWTDQEAEFLTVRNGVPIGDQGGSSWLFAVPEGFYKLIVHTYEEYDDPLIYVTENGYCEKNNKSLTITQARIDKPRIKYHQDHLAAMKDAIDVGARVKGYFVWSFLDNFEWADGYTIRFGMVYVDYENGLTRYPKTSAIWFMNFLSRKTILNDNRQVEEIENGNTIPAKRARNG
ncbi:hypothetical protein ABFX02_10G073500 [Erythranthe guttata]